MIDLSPSQAADRITALLAAHECRSLYFKRISAKHGRRCWCRVFIGLELLLFLYPVALDKGIEYVEKYN